MYLLSCFDIYPKYAPSTPYPKKKTRREVQALYRKWTLESLENHEYELKHVETFKSTPMVQELKQQDIIKLRAKSHG